MRGGSRNAIAKNRVPIAKVKIKMYATLSISLVPAYPICDIEANNSLPIDRKERSKKQPNLAVKPAVIRPFFTNCYKSLSFFLAG